MLMLQKELKHLLKIAFQVICEFLLERFLVSFDPSQRAMRPQKKQKDFGKKHNVAIKRVKSNASALAISSDSNIDEVNHTKVLSAINSISQNVEFLEVALIKTWVLNIRTLLPYFRYKKSKNLTIEVEFRCHIFEPCKKINVTYSRQ